MICIVLVAGHGTIIERDIQNDNTSAYKALVGVPKALLPGANKGKRILDYWWEIINKRQIFTEVYLVVNADKHKHFERWASASGFPVENIINDGSTTLEASLGAVADFELALLSKNIQDNVMVVAGDMLFEDQNFDINQVVQYFNHKKGDLAIYYEMGEKEDQSKRGIIEVDHNTNKIVKFYEKPLYGITKSNLATVVFYCFQNSTLPLVSKYLQDNTKIEDRAFGKFISWLINVNRNEVYGMKLPTRFQLIGQVTLKDYEEWLNYFCTKKKTNMSKTHFKCRTYARVGLMGNPSDAFHGKTISLSIANFWADVTIQESDNLVLVPHPLNDPTTFGSLQDLHGISSKEGYLGGLRLLQATCKKFYQYCCEKGIALYKRNFTLSYDTNIPRQVGLAGSSAIVTACLNCLMKFFNLTECDIPKPLRAGLILNVETSELCINAGLQDRVVQVYEGLVYMDFNKEVMEQFGHGHYENMNLNNIPNMFLAYLSKSSDSGKIHNDVRLRFDAGDEEVRNAMKKFAALAEKAKLALENQDVEKLGQLINSNFDLRHKIYGDDCIGSEMLEIVSIARKHGGSAKFPGSGGAIIGIYPKDKSSAIAMKKEMQSKEYVVCEIIPHIPIPKI